MNVDRFPPPNMNNNFYLYPILRLTLNDIGFLTYKKLTEPAKFVCLNYNYTSVGNTLMAL